MSKSTWTVRQVESDGAARAVYPLVAQLRPHLTDVDTFLARWVRQTEAGYQIVALYASEERPAALAGYRVQENLVHGRFLYVDDLVTDGKVRSKGYGDHLMRYLKEHAHRLGCSKLIVDTPLSNALGHRFYFRCGLLATSLRFAVPIDA